MLTVALFLHDIAKGRPEDHSIAGAKVARKLCPRLGLNAEPDRARRLAGRRAPHHVAHRPVARPLRPPHHHGFCADRADDGAAEAAPGAHRLRHPRRRAGRVERLEGPASPRALLRDRADPDRRLQRRVARAAACRDARRARPRGSQDWPEEERERILDLHYPAYWLRVDEERQVRHAEFVRDADAKGLQARLRDPADDVRGRRPSSPCSRPTIRALLSVIAGACAACDANIVDAQIFTTTRRARARHRRRQPRLRQRRGRGAARQAHRQADRAGAARAASGSTRRSPASGRRAAGAKPSRSSRR